MALFKLAQRDNQRKDQEPLQRSRISVGRSRPPKLQVNDQRHDVALVQEAPH